jgi:hypothetical protein
VALKRAFPVLSLLTALVSSCAELPDIERSVCGNSIVEPENGEACDTFAAGTGSRGLPTSCGGAGSESACLYVHDDTHDCPVGFGAGRDGVCRRPLGSFDAEIARLAPSGEMLRVADFDGDKVDDIFVMSPLAAEARVLLLSPGAVVRDTLLVSTTATTLPPALAELGGPSGLGAATDLLVPNPKGLGVYLGSAQGFQPKAYASVSLPVGARVQPVPALARYDDYGGVVGVLFTDLVATLVDDGPSTVELQLVDPDETPLARLPGFSVEDITGIARIDIQPASFFASYDDIVVGARLPGADAVVFVKPQAKDALRKVTPKVLGPPDLPYAADIVSGPFAWRVGTTPRVAVVVDDAARGPDARRLVVYDNDLTVEPKSYPLVGLNDDGEVIAMASGFFLGLIEFYLLVNQGGVDLGNIECDLAGVCQVVRSRLIDLPNVGTALEGGWTSAIIDPDVVQLVAASTTGVDHFRLDESGGVAATHIPTDAPVKAITRGDYDGDGARDTVAVLGTSEDCSVADELLVIYGEPSGLPGQIDVFGALPGVRLAATGPLLTEVFDGVDDVLLTTYCGDSERLALFEGATSRDLLSYLPLPGAGVNGDSVSLTAGRFGGTSDDLAVLSLISVGELAVTVVRNAGGAELGEIGPSATVPMADSSDLLLAAFSSRLAAGDADGDGIEEVAVCAPTVDEVLDPDNESTFEAELHVTPRCVVYSVGADGLTLRADVASTTTMTTVFLGIFAAQLSASWVDFDDDGKLDLLSIYRLADGTSTVVAFRGDGAGGLTETPIVLPEGQVFSAAVDGNGGVPNTTLLVASKEAVFACTPRSDSAALDCTTELVPGAEIGDEVRGGARRADR